MQSHLLYRVLRLSVVLVLRSKIQMTLVWRKSEEVVIWRRAMRPLPDEIEDKDECDKP